MTTIDRESLVKLAEQLLALAHAMEPEAPITWWGETLKPGEGWRRMVGIFEAERLQHQLLDAPFGREENGRPKPPPSLAACGLLIDTATREGWPGPHDHPFSRWDYVRGLQALYVGSYPTPAPRYENRPQQLDDDIRWLCQSEKGREFLAHPENRAVTGAEFVRLAGFKPVTRQRDGSLVEVD